MKMNFVAPCLFGLEGALADELKQMEATDVHAENGRVLFSGDEYMLARANICSRFAERILILLGEFEATSFEELFQGTKKLPWEEFIREEDMFPVKGYSINSELHSVPDCQAIIKKAVVERLKSKYKISWFDESGPKHQIQFSILKDQVSIMLDTSGAGLHKRGYRPDANDAPIKETLAAGMAYFSKLRHYHTLYDPFCGSGTILIEGAMLANNIAPGVKRLFSADKWDIFPEHIWKEERVRAKSLVKKDTDFVAFGSDADAHAIALTGMNAQRVGGIDKMLRLSTADIKEFNPTTEKGTLICNPPYGERLLDAGEANAIYRSMGKVFQRQRGWSYSIISPSETFEQEFGRIADKRRKLYNGMIKCQLFMYFK